MSKKFNFKEHWDIWEPLLKTNGKWDEKKIKAEMHDLLFIFSQVSEVYSTLTGGLLGKTTYYADTIIGLHNDEVNKAYHNGYADAEEELGDK